MQYRSGDDTQVRWCYTISSFYRNPKLTLSYAHIKKGFGGIIVEYGKWNKTMATCCLPLIVCLNFMLDRGRHFFCATLEWWKSSFNPSRHHADIIIYNYKMSYVILWINNDNTNRGWATECADLETGTCSAPDDPPAATVRNFFFTIQYKSAFFLPVIYTTL